ncbi:hypothetical protein BDV12DRAFT_105893 [Aspergillus spectabilis]
MLSSKANCAECTCQGHRYKQELFAASDYEKMSRQKDDLDEQLAQALAKFEEKSQAFAEAQHAISNAQQATNNALAKIKHLERQRKFLKERGIKMVEHDIVLDPGNAESPTQSSIAGPVLAATSENPTLSLSEFSWF